MGRSQGNTWLQFAESFARVFMSLIIRAKKAMCETSLAAF